MAPMPPLRSTHTGVIEAMATCQTCGWSNEDRHNALATGSIHARRYGHHVEVEQTISITYNKGAGS